MGEKIKNITSEKLKKITCEKIVTVCLGLALFFAISKDDQQLSQLIATGLIGYIGGTKTTM